jgi:hypothetical protein
MDNNLSKEHEFYIKDKVQFIKICKKNLAEMEQNRENFTNSQLYHVEKFLYNELDALKYFCDKNGLDYKEYMNKY